MSVLTCPKVKFAQNYMKIMSAAKKSALLYTKSSSKNNVFFRELDDLYNGDSRATIICSSNVFMA